MNKNTTQRLIDVTVASIGVGDPIATTESLPLRRADQYPAPSGIYVVSQTLYRNTSTPSVLVTLQWNPPVLVPYDYFSVQVSQDSDFDPTETYTSVSNSASIVLKTATTYYARVATVYKNAVSSYCSGIALSTISDTTAPADISSLTFAWSKGDLLITIPAQNVDLVKDTRIRIYNSAGTILYKEEFSTNTVRFTAEENQRLAGTPQITVNVQAQNRSWGNVYSVGTYSVNTTSPAPSGIANLTTNWNGDTGTAAADCIITWNSENSASAYVVRINSATTYQTTDNKFVYPWEENRRVNTPSGLYTLPIAVWAVNKLGQSGVLATVTHTNAAPTTSGASISALAGFSQIVASVTHAQIDDVWQYKWQLLGATTQTIVTTAKDVIFTAQDAGNQYIRCNIIDRFGRASSDIDSNTLYIEPLTISGLRVTFRYTDSQSTSPITLAGLKDDDLTTNVVSHNNTTASSRWTQGERDLLDRVKTITFAANGSVRFYFTTSDGTTTRYFAGPLTSGRILTEYASSALAESNYLTYDGTTRYDLPSIVEARIFRTYHWISSGTYYLREFYPRRLIQSDDIEAETIKGLNIAALAITADKISVINLQAVSAYTGNLVVSGVLSIATNGGLYQGTGSFSSPTTGLKLYNSNGIGVLSTFNNGVTQVSFNTGGELTAGANRVRLSVSGIVIDCTPSGYLPIPQGSLRFFDFSANKLWSELTHYTDSFGTEITLLSHNRLKNSAASALYFESFAESDGSVATGIALQAYDTTPALKSYLYLTAPTASAVLGSTGAVGISTGSQISLYGGGVYIGDSSTAPTANLDVARGSLSNGTAMFRGTSYNSHFHYSTSENTYIRGGKIDSSIYIGDQNTTGTGSTLVYAGTGGLKLYSNNTLCATINQYANMGVGAAPGQYTKLNAQAGGTSSTYYAFIATNSTPSNLMLLRADGYSWINQAWTVGSSRELKENIADLTVQDAIKMFAALRPRKYTLKNDPAKEQYGFVTDEVATDASNLVRDDGIQYTNLIAPLALIVRNLYQRVTQLEQALAK